jgi:hypothetical protein
VKRFAEDRERPEKGFFRLKIFFTLEFWQRSLAIPDMKRTEVKKVV